MELFFRGQKYTREEFIKSFDMENDSEEFRDMIIEKLVRRGEIKFPEKTGRQNKVIESVINEIALEQQIASYSDNGQFTRGHLYNKVEIDLYMSNEVGVICGMLEDAGIEHVLVKKDTCYLLTITDIAEADLAIIKNQLSKMRVDRNIKNGLAFVEGKTVGAIDFASSRVAAPVVKTSVKTAIGIGRVLAKTVTAVGASVISSTASGVRTVAKELVQDEDVLKAKKEMLGIKNSAKKLMGKSSFSMGDSIRVVE